MESGLAATTRAFLVLRVVEACRNLWVLTVFRRTIRAVFSLATRDEAVSGASRSASILSGNTSGTPPKPRASHATATTNETAYRRTSADPQSGRPPRRHGRGKCPCDIPRNMARKTWTEACHEERERSTPLPHRAGVQPAYAYVWKHRCPRMPADDHRIQRSPRSFSYVRVGSSQGFAASRSRIHTSNVSRAANVRG